LLHRTLNLGILAHVDAGKTTLTERLLYETGVIAELGSVDAGTTQTDSLALERQRGITIRSAVASFRFGDLPVNLIDTPGHPDFIAEVERVLGVLDGAVLVLSAVEGVQPQTRILMRALQRLRIPTVLFINKVDRSGADPDRVLREIATRLTPDAAPTTEVLAEHDDDLLAAYVAGRVTEQRIHEALVAQTRQAAVHPVFTGSALTGVGVRELMQGIADLLPVPAGDPDAPVSGTVFKIERGAGGEKIAHVRLFAGTIRVRDRVGDDKVTALGPGPRRSFGAGEVAEVRGLASVRVGDRIGEGAPRDVKEFPPPTFESAVTARSSDERARLHDALVQLAEQDPLIDVRRDPGGELSVSLYGEVQKEVIQATLATAYGLEVEFRETTPIYVERPLRSAEARELLHADTNPYLASIGLRIDPAPAESGVAFRLDVDPRTTPLYVYKTLAGFEEHMGEYVREALGAGLYGWRVTDCTVTMTSCMYSVPDGPPSRRGPLSTAADFRKLTPLVVRQALAKAGTAVCEPIMEVRVEAPATSVGAALAAVARLGGSPGQPSVLGDLAIVETVLAADRTQDLQRELPGLTGGEGVLESRFAGYRPREKRDVRTGATASRTSR
jgi:ribosomal protection tetracycline resistance protein